VLNKGKITLTGNGYNVGIYYDNSDSISKIYTKDPNLQSTITNTGTIEITGGETPQENGAFVGIEAFGSEDGKLKIINKEAITIEGNANLVGISAENGDINNEGEIKLNISDNDIASSNLYVTGISAAGSSKITTNEGSTITIIGANAEAIGIDVDDKVSVENNGDISVTGAGEIYGIKAGDEATISGAGDITLNGTNTSETSQKMYGIYAKDKANITYTGNIKNESTDTNVTMIAVQAGDNSTLQFGSEDIKDKTIDGDIYFGNYNTITNYSTINGNFKDNGINDSIENVTIINYQKISGNIGKVTTLNNKAGATIEGNIYADELNNYASIDAGEIKNNEIMNGDSSKTLEENNQSVIRATTIITSDIYNYGEISVSDTISGSADFYNYNLIESVNIKNITKLENHGQITVTSTMQANEIKNESDGDKTASIEADTIKANTITNGSASHAEANITATTINAQEIKNNYGTINGKITTETLQNTTVGASIKSSELIARNIENSGTINIGNGTLAANKIGNYTDEENGKINVSAGMTFMPIANSDSDDSGADIDLSTVLTFDEANDD
ncbi:MAG: hypothetical protein IKA03_01970, partial [Alphaproteobacteria bacterium]|nr:hypothetical protein [Alphaproteobacteria bacterium]